MLPYCPPGYVPHCGVCGRPFASAIGVQQCECADDPPIKLRKDIVGMTAAIALFNQAIVATAPALQEAVRDMRPTSIPPLAALPPCGVCAMPMTACVCDMPPPPKIETWRDRPPML